MNNYKLFSNNVLNSFFFDNYETLIINKKKCRKYLMTFYYGFKKYKETTTKHDYLLVYDYSLFNKRHKIFVDNNEIAILKKYKNNWSIHYHNSNLLPIEISIVSSGLFEELHPAKIRVKIKGQIYINEKPEKINNGIFGDPIFKLKFKNCDKSTIIPSRSNFKIVNKNNEMVIQCCKIVQNNKELTRVYYHTSIDPLVSFIISCCKNIQK